MKIHSIPVTKAKLDQIPEIERAFYVHIGHLRNELMVLKKLLERFVKNPSDNPVLRDVNLFQSLIIARLLAGKLWEGWELTRKAYFSTKLSLTNRKQLARRHERCVRKPEEVFWQEKHHRQREK